MLKFDDTPMYKITYKNGYVRYSKNAFGNAKCKSLHYEMEKVEDHSCNYKFVKTVNRIVNGVKIQFSIYKCEECGRKCEIVNEL